MNHSRRFGRFCKSNEAQASEGLGFLVAGLHPNGVTGYG
jgi:hypothetical protein